MEHRSQLDDRDFAHRQSYGCTPRAKPPECGQPATGAGGSGIASARVVVFGSSLTIAARWKADALEGVYVYHTSRAGGLEGADGLADEVLEGEVCMKLL